MISADEEGEGGGGRGRAGGGRGGGCVCVCVCVCYVLIVRVGGEHGTQCLHPLISYTHSVPTLVRLMAT